MEGASAWNKTGRCGQKVNCPEGAREGPLEDKDKANARARAIALAEAQTHLTTIRYK